MRGFFVLSLFPLRFKVRLYGISSGNETVGKLCGPRNGSLLCHVKLLSLCYYYSHAN